ncbi:hypothetical protein N332_13842, partial [Mesitornis unicolor]
WFSVTDVKGAFWACPLAEESRDLFAFKWEDLETGGKQQLRWTKLPQGFTESPNLFGQALEEILQQFQAPPGIQVLQYVDDLLVSGSTEEAVRAASIELLGFLGQKGLRVSKKKLQFVQTEVKYLGHLVSEGKRKISPDRIMGVVSLPLPKTEREMRQLLGLLGYCRLWIEGYTQAVRFLYEKLLEEVPLCWVESEKKQLEELKNKLITAPVLELPSSHKPFYLFVN